MSLSKLNVLEVVVAVMEDELNYLHEKVDFMYNNNLTLEHAWSVHNLKKGQIIPEKTEGTEDEKAELTDFAKSNYGS